MLVAAQSGEVGSKGKEAGWEPLGSLDPLPFSISLPSLGLEAGAGVGRERVQTWPVSLTWLRS